MNQHNLFLQSGILMISLASVLFCEMTTSLDANFGYFILPENIRGFVEEGFYEAGRGNVYVTEVDGGSGYSRTSYRYSHDFGTDMKPNIGFSISPLFFLHNGIGFGFEASNGFSIDEVNATHTVSDSLGRDSYSPVPHAYRTKQTTSKDQIFTKYRYFGFTLAFRRQFLAQSRLRFDINAGWAGYTAVFRIEELSGSLQYHQTNGHVVHTEIRAPTFYTFGIRYTSFVVKPGIALERHLTPQVSVNSGVTLPFSYIEKGYKWSDDAGVDDDIVFYPGNRFVAGNLLISLGVTLHFIRER
ncbi:MAG: hypothetical protein GF401_00905 [Chitinivibrionales bacterium]|nr:hypothetical protein [Chitinivibrionales bacterium]